MQSVELDEGGVVVVYRLNRAVLSTSEHRRNAHQDFIDLICKFREAGFTTIDFDLRAEILFTNSFGREGYDIGVSVLVTSDTAAQIDCDNKSGVSIQTIADGYYIDQSID